MLAEISSLFRELEPERNRETIRFVYGYRYALTLTISSIRFVLNQRGISHG